MSLNSLLHIRTARHTSSWCRHWHSSYASSDGKKLITLSPSPLLARCGETSSFLTLNVCNRNSLISPHRIGGIVRTQSNKATTKPDPSPLTPPPTPINTDTTFVQSAYRETHLFLQFLREIIFVDMPVLLPRVIAFVATLQLTTEYGFQTVSCEGPSMEPTIIDGSYSCILIERWSHRIFGLETDDHASEKMKRKSLAEQRRSEGSWYELFRGLCEQHFASGLQHGDVIILQHPAKEATICKRIIGMPGDVIVRTDGGESSGCCGEVTNHRIVPSGHLWIEGDNTRNSLDSRSYGSVPASLVIGKVICRLWPLRDYISLGKDANGMEHWRRVGARIGRGERPAFGNQAGNVGGSYVLHNERRKYERN